MNPTFDPLATSVATAPEWSRVVVGALFVLTWAAMLLGAPLLLPVQVASWLTFIALFIAPGYLLADIVARPLNLDWVERLALAFPLGVAVMALPGLTALLQHYTLHELASLWIVATSVVTAVWIVFAVWMLLRPAVRVPAKRWSWAHLLLAAILVVAYVAMLPALMLYKIDGDAYAVGSFSADALAGLPLNAAEPLFGTDIGPGVRMAFNQALPMSYLWSYWSGIAPLPLTAVASRPMIALWALLAAYMLGKQASDSVDGGRRLGLLTAAVQVLIYMAGPFLRGDNVSLFFFERVTADKFMVPVTMLPVVAALAIRYLRMGEKRSLVAAAMVTFAVSAIHPLIAAMLALAMGALAGVHFLMALRNRLAMVRSLALGVLVAIAMALPLVQLVLARGEAPLAESYPKSVEGWPLAEKLVPALPFLYAPTLDVYGTLPDLSQMEAEEADSITNPFLIWRFAVNMERRRLILFDVDHYISDPNILLEPPYLLALLLLPFFFLRLRRSISAQFSIGVTLGVLFVMFNPIVTPLIGSLVMPWILWRFVWIIPYALIIAMAAEGLVDTAARGVARMTSLQAQKSARLERRFAGYGGPTLYCTTLR